LIVFEIDRRMAAVILSLVGALGCSAASYYCHTIAKEEEKTEQKLRRDITETIDSTPILNGIGALNLIDEKKSGKEFVLRIVSRPPDGVVNAVENNYPLQNGVLSVEESYIHKDASSATVIAPVPTLDLGRFFNPPANGSRVDALGLQMQLQKRDTSTFSIRWKSRDQILLDPTFGNRGRITPAIAYRPRRSSWCSFLFPVTDRRTGDALEINQHIQTLTGQPHIYRVESQFAGQSFRYVFQPLGANALYLYGNVVGQGQTSMFRWRFDPETDPVVLLNQRKAEALRDLPQSSNDYTWGKVMFGVGALGLGLYSGITYFS
jgi:hypothetical protein